MEAVVRIWAILAIAYFILYNTLNLSLALLAWVRVRFFLRLKTVNSLGSVYASASTPPVSIIVPAFNEQETVVESVRSLTKLYYPELEIVIVNDGSSDRTLDELTAAFGFHRRDVGYEPIVATRPIRGFYDAPAPADTPVTRFILVDKENGGKADALNAGLNAALSPLVCCIDSDSIIERDALIEIVQPMVEDPAGVAACGGQVGVANGSRFEKGRVVEVALPKNWLALFQLVEYMRSFTAGRTALVALDSLLILSGVFAVFRKELVLAVGGFLTDRLQSRIAREYCGSRSTVCEDMEIIVRLKRYLIEKKMRAKIFFLPYPITFSQVPERVVDFGRQRDRWYRGLAQGLFYHRKMLFNPRYGRVGLFAMPYQFVFEFLGPLAETGGYLLVPFFYFAGMLNVEYLLFFMAASVLYGVLVSVAAVLMGLWTEGKLEDARRSESLFRYRGFRSAVILIVFAALSVIGYRQLQLVYLVRGFVGFLRGRQTWEKFSRRRFS